MNIFLQKIQILLVLAFLGLAFLANAQPSSYEHHQIPLNEEFVITALPAGFPSIPTYGRPSHGSLWIQFIGNQSQVVYKPDSNFVGLDTFYFNVINFPSSNVTMGYSVQVSESIVMTKRDFVSTLTGTSATVFPLENDSTTTGTLHLKNVSPIFNHGTVQIGTDDFEFTPDNGFKGITHMSYIACNDFGACEKGIISVLVHDISLPSSQTTEVLTGKEEAIPVLLPYPDYMISQAPANGTVELLEDFAYLYTPNAGFSGQDVFTFELTTANGTSQYTVNMEVMDIPPANTFAQDDYVYSPLNYYGFVNVLNNDQGNLLGWSLNINSPPSNGAAWLDGSGYIKYVPHQNFEGVDKLTYTIANALGVYETATVYFTTSNFAPGASSFELNTYDDTPLYFEYNPPILPSSYTFNILQTPLYGNLVVTSNSVLYTPVVGFTGTESFELEYCVNGNCYPFDLNVNVAPSVTGVPGCAVSTECVWAGDMNEDGVVDGKDILYLCATGEVGSPRENGTTDWIGQFSAGWTNTVSGIAKNVKHIDADGDSLITQLDANVVDLNYGKRNRITPQVLPTQQNPLQFIYPNTVPEPGDTIVVEVRMGTVANPALDFSGIGFQMYFDPQIFDTAYVVFDEHSWLGYDAPVKSYSNNSATGKLDMAFTRGNETSKSGFGKIGQVHIVIEDLNGIRLDEDFTTLNFTDSYALTGSGHMTKLNDEIVKVRINESDYDPELRKNPLNLYPNPTDDNVTVQTNYYNPMEEIRILNMVGQVVEIHTVENTNEVNLNVSHLKSGVYLIDVQAKDGPMSKKLQVITK